MTVNDWEGTPWSGTIPESRALTIPPPMGMATVGKAAFGAGVSVYETGVTLSSLTRNPRRIMRDAQAAYRNHTWIRVAERAVTRKVAGLPWHLEDGEDVEIDDTSDPVSKAILDLFEQPQAKLSASERQPGINSWRGLVSITSRHMGLCNLAHWYFDGRDISTGIPNAILYLNPARMEPVTSTSGHLIRWSLDADQDGRNGTPLELDEVLTFYLDPPDQGYQGAGLYEAVLLKTRVTTIADQHATYVLGTGGRIPGIVSPKEGYIDNPDTFKALVNEFRNVNEAADAAKRTTILRGPVDYIRTGLDNEDMSLVELSKMNREDILTTWGVPPSQAPIGMPGGLNSGDTKSFDEAVLMQGAVHDRVIAIKETVQYGMLDRFTTILELEIEEPEFDDETPAYERAEKSASVAMMRNERRAIIGLDPLPDYDPVTGAPLGIAIDMPFNLTVVGAGPSEEKRPVVTVPVLPALESGEIPAKASLASIRTSLIGKTEPKVRKAVQLFLTEQRSAIAAAIRAKAAHLSVRHTDKDAWWDPKRWDAELATVLRGPAEALATSAGSHIEGMIRPGKATFTESVLRSILAAVGRRIKGINLTTRDSVAAAVEQGFANGLSPAQIADLIEGLPAFDASRAELVARTETALTYNDAALASYQELDVSQVEAIDGDEDPECAERNGQVYSIEDAMQIEDHPNGTLDWLPVLAPAKAVVAEQTHTPPPDRMMDLLTALVAGKADAPSVHVVMPENIDIPTPIVNYTAPDIHYTAEAPIVNVPQPVVVIEPRPPMRTVIDRDGEGRITGSHEEPV